MGKPMKSRILSIVLAISMIAVLFAALPTRGDVTYTGTVITTDSSGIPKTDFLQGEDVYVNVTVMTNGVPSDETILVVLQRTNDAHQIASFTADTNNPVVGVYNSTIAASHLHLSTAHSITGDVQSYNLIVTVYGNKVAEMQITVRATGLWLDPLPNQPAYWPGEVITVSMVVTEAQTGLVFYVQVLNETDAPTTLNFTDQVALNGYWTDQFVIGATLPDGTYHLNVRAKSDNSFFFPSVYFEVQAYELLTNVDRSVYLPGETASISYVVIDLATLTQMSSGVTITYSAEYANKTGNLTWKNGTLPVTSNVWSFVLPTNGTAADSIGLFSNIDVTITAKQAAGNRSVEDHMTLFIGLLDGSADMADHTLVPGNTAVVNVYASVGGSNLPGALVTVKVYKNGSEEVAGYGSASLTTDQYGQASYAFATSATAADGNYRVVATISKLGYSVQRETQFSIGEDKSLAISWDKAYYTGGETATVTFEPVLNGAIATVSSVGYLIQLNGQVLAQANTTSLSASVTVPEGITGMLMCMAFTHINGQIIENSAVADVVFAELGLTSVASSYRPGDTIEFVWSIVTALTGANLTYEIVDDKGVRVESGTLEFAKTGTFDYKVPDASPLLSQEYTATMWMSTSSGVSTAHATVDLIGVQELVVWVADSKYSSGDYAPGQKIKINFRLDANTFASPPLIRLHVSTSWDPIQFDYVSDKASGSVTYTIPDDAPVGPFYIMVTASDAATGASLGDDTTSITVNNRLGTWDRSIGGMAAIDFLLLVLLIIVIVVLILVPVLKGRMGAPKAPEPVPPAEEGKLPPP